MMYALLSPGWVWLVAYIVALLVMYRVWPTNSDARQAGRPTCIDQDNPSEGNLEC